MIAPGLFVDRDGDVWRVGGHTKTGETLLVCDSPRNPGEAGSEGPTHFPWTYQTVDRWFGPLMRWEFPRVAEPTALVTGNGTWFVPVERAA